MVNQYAAMARRGSPAQAFATRMGQARPAAKFSERMATPMMVEEAASLANKMTCGVLGGGESTSASRLSGKVASQLTTAKRPTTSMMPEMCCCSAVQQISRNISGGASAKKRALRALTMLMKMRTPANWPINLGMSASIESASRSITRSRNCRYSTRNWSGNRRINLRMNKLRDLPGRGSGVLLDGELREDLFERGQIHH